MAEEHISVYIEDHPTRAHLNHPSEVDILSPVIVNDIEHTDIDTIHICRRGPEGAEVHGDSRKNADNIPTSRLLFNDVDEGNYSRLSLYPPMAAVPGMRSTFWDNTEIRDQTRRNIAHLSKRGQKLDLESITDEAHRPIYFHYHLRPTLKPDTVS